MTGKADLVLLLLTYVLIRYAYYSVFHNFISPLIFLEIMIIIKIDFLPCYLIFVTDLNGDEAKTINIKWADPKKTELFMYHQFLIFVHQNFRDWSLGN